MALLTESKKTPEKISAEEYLALEENADHKSEYYHGEVFAMAGASYNHNVISVNLVHTFHGKLADSRVFSSDMKICVEKKKFYTYPDLSIVCGNIEFEEGRTDIIANPAVIVEILSDSTKDYDRGTKFAAYRRIASLQHYVLVDQYSIHVEHFERTEKNTWLPNEFEDIKDSFRINAVNAEFELKSAYNDIRFEHEDC